MVEREFIEQYKNSEFDISIVESGDIYAIFIFVGDHELTEEEETFFWNCYQHMETVSEDNKTEKVKFKNGRSLRDTLSSK